jgi:hypothetical protein
MINRATLNKREQEYYMMDINFINDRKTGQVLAEYKGEPIGNYSSRKAAEANAPKAVQQLQAGIEPEARLVGDGAKVRALKQASSKQAGSTGKSYRRRNEVRTTAMTASNTNNIHFR